MDTAVQIRSAMVHHCVLADLGVARAKALAMKAGTAHTSTMHRDTKADHNTSLSSLVSQR